MQKKKVNFWNWPLREAERGTFVKAPIHHSAELGAKESRLGNSHRAFCPSDVLGKETTILSGEREAKHNSNVLSPQEQ